MKRFGTMALASAIACAVPMISPAAAQDRMGPAERMGPGERMGPDRMGADRMGPERMGPAERQHAMDTLRLGSVALETSRIAERSAVMGDVRQFARFEVMEQDTVGQIVREMSGMAPPPLDMRGRAMIETLRRARGPAFDRAYVDAQIQGHRELLAVQERYLATGRNPHQRHIAMLARGQITEHLALLNAMQRPGRR